MTGRIGFIIALTVILTCGTVFAAVPQPGKAVEIMRYENEFSKARLGYVRKDTQPGLVVIFTGSDE